jgi:hypothetical protein
MGGGLVQFAPVLHLTDDLVSILAAHESTDPDEVRVGLAAPSWLGWCDRHHVARLIDSTGRCQLVWASSPVVAAVGTSMSGATPLAAELVVAVDLDLGVGASVVSIDRTGVRELVAASAPPNWGSRSEAVTAVVSGVAALATDLGLLGANRIVVVADGPRSGELVEQTIRALDRPWGECPVDIVRSRADIARAAVQLADLEGFEVIGAAPRSVGVLLDDADSGRSSVHVIVPRNAAVPTRSTATFDLGPDDGAEVYLDVYEEQLDERPPAGRSPERRGHRLVMTAHLEDSTDDALGVAPSRRTDEIDLSFVVGADGMLRLEPTSADARTTWTCTWAESRTVLSASGAAGGESIRTLLDAMPDMVPDTPSAGHHARSSATAVGRRRIREMSPPLGLAEALGRAERVVSRQVGRLLAIRSAPALFGSSDRDDAEVLHDRADRLDRVLALCAEDDVVHVVRAALEVGRRAVDAGAGRLFVGGTTHDVAQEIERVIEHLAVVIGAVTPAERNRLVVDAQLLGLDHDRARSLVDELINDAGVDSDGRPEELRDQTATVVVSANGFRLAPVDVRLDHDEAAVKVLLL